MSSTLGKKGRAILLGSSVQIMEGRPITAVLQHISVGVSQVEDVHTTCGARSAPSKPTLNFRWALQGTGLQALGFSIHCLCDLVARVQ